MTNQFSQIKWVRVLLTSAVIYMLSFLTVLLTVTAYATYLGFQARGAPDMSLIESFANQVVPWVGGASLLLFTFLGALHAARRVDSAVQLHGIIVGVLAGVLHIVVDQTLEVSVVITALLAVGAGWLGATLIARRGSAT